MLSLSTLAASNHAETRASSMTSSRSRSEVKRHAGRDGRTAGPAPDVLLGGSAASSRDPQISYRRVWVGDLGIERGLRKRLQNILRFRPDHRDLDRLFAIPGPLPQVDVMWGRT